MHLRSLLRPFVKSSIVGFLSIALLQIGFAGDLPHTVPAEADQHVATALKFEVEGDAEFRQLALELALRIDPENAAGRWHSGQVQVEGEWLPIEEAEAKWRSDERLSEYREMRSRNGATAQGDLLLARWCNKQQLADQARYHWSRVLSSLPEYQEEALRQLELKPYFDGMQTMLLGPAEFERRQIAASQASEAFEHYLPICQELRKRLQTGTAKLQNAARSRLADIRDPLAIPALEAALSAAGEPFASIVIYQLDKMPEHEATMSLVRHAAFAPAVQTREVAARSLAKRDISDYAPWLLDQLVSPVKSDYWLDRTPDGAICYFHDFHREGKNGHLLARRAATFRSQPLRVYREVHTYGLFSNELQRTHVENLPSTEASEEARLGYKLAHQLTQIEILATIAQRENDTAQANRAIDQWNGRLASVLEATSRKTLGRNPVDWWNWWQEYNELHTPNLKPVRSYYTQTNHRIVGPATWAERRTAYVNDHGTTCPSCFAAGTLVAAEDGLKPIKSIQPGDRVLAQDPETGELAHKLVLGTTVRPPTDLLKLTIGEEEILATKGHPFWIVGEGWRMAKFVEAGERIHSTSGAVVVDSIEDLNPALAYNLVVEDFHSYFVGKQRLLVHDNLLRKPTLAVVPGLKEKT